MRLIRRNNTADQAELRHSGQRGQVLVLFVLVTFIVIGMTAVVVDVAWFWNNQQRMQRAADAGALAGAVYLPGDKVSAYAAARAEATKNGYTDGVGGVTVTPNQDISNRRRLRVTITGPVDAFFARVFCAIGACTRQVDARVTGLAEFVLPVPMGSPQNYFGVGYLVDAERVVTTTTVTNNNSANVTAPASSFPSGGSWTVSPGSPGNVYTNNDQYAIAQNSNAAQQWGGFNFNLPATTTSITAIQVLMDDLFLQGSGTSTDCRVRAEISWNNGSSWSTAQQTGTLGTTNTTDYIVGSQANMTSWGSHNWTRNELTNSFRVRLTFLKANCASTRRAHLDQLRVRVYYNYTTTSTVTTTTYPSAPKSVTGPYGGVLAPQNFWAAMNSQGAPNIQGDAYLTKYETRTSALNVVDDTDPDGYYAPNDFYNYGVEIPAGGSGELWIFDPGFCDAGSTGLGTGEFWTVGAPNGNATRQPLSSYFDLYNTQDTPYDYSDDTLVSSSGNTFAKMSYQDSVLFGAAGATPSMPDCRTLEWHHGWWKLASGLTGGRTYRLHTYTTDKSSPSDQNNTTAHNAFAFWAKSTVGTPRIYGIGAMEAYVRLPGGVASEFYLAQIDAVHAGKTMLIDLWDPGDTGNLSASLQILKPTASNYSATSFDYSAISENSASSSCNSKAGTNVTSVTTSTGGGASGSQFNGCWLTISVKLPSDYSAPHPSSDSVTSEGGWWKIRYSMGGSTSDHSTDLTTWQVSIRGSPVHLVPE